MKRRISWFGGAFLCLLALPVDAQSFLSWGTGTVGADEGVGDGEPPPCSRRVPTPVSGFRGTGEISKEDTVQECWKSWAQTNPVATWYPYLSGLGPETLAELQAEILTVLAGSDTASGDWIQGAVDLSAPGGGMAYEILLTSVCQQEGFQVAKKLILDHATAYPAFELVLLEAGKRALREAESSGDERLGLSAPVMDVTLHRQVAGLLQAYQLFLETERGAQTPLVYPGGGKETSAENMASLLRWIVEHEVSSLLVAVRSAADLKFHATFAERFNVEMAWIVLGDELNSTDLPAQTMAFWTLQASQQELIAKGLEAVTERYGLDSTLTLVEPNKGESDRLMASKRGGESVDVFCRVDEMSEKKWVKECFYPWLQGCGKNGRCALVMDVSAPTAVHILPYLKNEGAAFCEGEPSGKCLALMGRQDWRPGTGRGLAANALLKGALIPLNWQGGVSEDSVRFESAFLARFGGAPEMVCAVAFASLQVLDGGRTDAGTREKAFSTILGVLQRTASGPGRIVHLGQFDGVRTVGFPRESVGKEDPLKDSLDEVLDGL